MATVQEHLNQYGVSTMEALSFILDNVNNLQYVHDVCKNVGVTNSMIAELFNEFGYYFTGDDIKYVFAYNGIDSSDLDGETGNSLFGNLDMSNLTDYSEIMVYENLSQSSIMSIVENNTDNWDAYYVAHTDEILSGPDYGYTNQILSGVANVYTLPGDYTHTFSTVNVSFYTPGDYDLVAGFIN